MKKIVDKKDYLVIGSGIAGLTVALKLAPVGSVSLITKKKLEDSATNLAQGGIAAALSKNDNPKCHYQDTIKAGAGLCNKN
ncbi:MAG: FAD-binding protein, partial [Candidatus Margulisbacteria bacterium]|nr:FAD-binding protein [Candidatus Margulisiibacteriota bacterium]